MPDFIRFVVIWLLFMVLMGAIALVVPKLASKIDKTREKYKNTKRDNMFPLGQTSFMEPAEGLETQKQEETVENNENIADGQRTE